MTLQGLEHTEAAAKHWLAFLLAWDFRLIRLDLTQWLCILCSGYVGYVFFLFLQCRTVGVAASI